MLGSRREHIQDNQHETGQSLTDQIGHLSKLISRLSGLMTNHEDRILRLEDSTPNCLPTFGAGGIKPPGAALTESVEQYIAEQRQHQDDLRAHVNNLASTINTMQTWDMGDRLNHLSGGLDDLCDRLEAIEQSAAEYLPSKQQGLALDDKPAMLATQQAAGKNPGPAPHQDTIKIDLRKSGDMGYMGASLTFAPEPGEDWCRGRDLADGPLTMETAESICREIMGYTRSKIDGAEFDRAGCHFPPKAPEPAPRGYEIKSVSNEWPSGKKIIRVHLDESYQGCIELEIIGDKEGPWSLLIKGTPVGRLFVDEWPREAVMALHEYLTGPLHD